MIRPDSKLPFYIPDGKIEHEILDANNTLVAEVDGVQVFNKPNDFEFIVHSCNNYEKLVDITKNSQKLINELILSTPTGELRNKLCDCNIELLKYLTELKEI